MQTAVLFALLFTTAQSSLIKKYHYISWPKTWESARLYCKENYTELAFIDSQTDEENLLAAAADAEFNFAWIGLHRDLGNITGWKWTGRPGAVTYTNWGLYEPNVYGNMETKAAMKKGRKWVDIDDTHTLPFFCVRVFGMQETKKSWEEALQHCRGASSDLASLHSNTSNPTTERLWVGLRFLAGRWLWVSGEPLWYRAWSTAAGQEPREPQCPATTRCGALSPEGVWEARDCQEKLGFICNNPLW